MDMPAPPAAMTAILPAGPGGPEVLKLGETDTPRPGPGQALVRVAAAGVNRPDVFQRKGGYPPPPGAPDILGLEVAGTVAALGPGVDTLSVGEDICALVPGGGYAAYACVDAALALPVPAGFSMVEAASLPETYFTVWTNLMDDAGLAEGETALIHGGTSGIGVAAIQLAKAVGARVGVTCGSQEKCDAAKGLGADIAINYKEEDFVDVLKAEGGADVVLDMVGGDYVARNMKTLKPLGRHVTIALLRGPKAEIDLTPILRRRVRLSGSVLRPRSVEEKAGIARQLKARVWPLFETGALRPVIDTVFPLQDAAKAHARMETSAHVGKIVLSVD